MNNLLIKNVNIIDAFQNFHGDVYIEDGKIKEIGLELNKEGVEVLNGNGQVLMPSFIDTHAHFREPGLTHKEDIESGSKDRKSTRLNSSHDRQSRMPSSA